MDLMFNVHPVTKDTPLPEASLVSSVAIIAINKAGKMLVTRHVTRGPDIPGGHVDPGEEVAPALARELEEETGGSVTGEQFIAKVFIEPSEGKYQGKCMCIFVADNFTLRAEWTPAHDVSERMEMDPDEFIKQYQGDKTFIKEIMRLAKERLSEQERGREQRRELPPLR